MVPQESWPCALGQCPGTPRSMRWFFFASALRRHLWCFSRFSSFFDEQRTKQIETSRGFQDPAELLCEPSPAGGPVHPQPRVRMVVKECTRVFTAVAPEITRHPRTQWFTAYTALSPEIGLCCLRRLRKLPSTNLTPASRRQDHTSSPSASAPFVIGTSSVHRIPPRVRDDREPPLRWDETA
jgi:hypothetical protein